jgi:hypothetical protein
LAALSTRLPIISSKSWRSPRKRRPGVTLVSKVRSDGPGLPPEARVAVLERGRRLDETKPGSGLGLSIDAGMGPLGGVVDEVADHLLEVLALAAEAQARGHAGLEGSASRPR